MSSLTRESKTHIRQRTPAVTFRLGRRGGDMTVDRPHAQCLTQMFGAAYPVPLVSGCLEH
jgi:hypothetical protein